MIALAVVPVVVYVGLGYLVGLLLSKKGWCPEVLRLILLAIAPFVWPVLGLFVEEWLAAWDASRRYEEAVGIAVLCLRGAAVIFLFVFAVENIRTKRVVNRVLGYLWMVVGVLFVLVSMSSC